MSADQCRNKLLAINTWKKMDVDHLDFITSYTLSITIDFFLGFRLVMIVLASKYNIKHALSWR